MIYLLAFLTTLVIYCLLSYTEIIHDSDYSILWLMLIFGILLLIFGSLAHGL